LAGFVGCSAHRHGAERAPCGQLTKGAAVRPSLLLPLLLSLSSLATATDASLEDPKKTVVAILMFDGVQIIDFAAPYEVFSQAGYTIYTVSKDGQAVKAAQGLRSQVDHSYASAPQADIVVVPGGDVHAIERDEATLTWLRKQAPAADHVMSVCTGSFILGRSGLLDGASATTFHRAFDSMQKEFPKVKVLRDQRWVDAGKVVTSSGLASGIDTSLHVVAEMRGLKVARSVAMNLEYDWNPQAGFVRGKFADRHYRLPSTLRMPEGTRVDEVTSIGDAQSWEVVYLIESPLGPEKFVETVIAQARQDADFAVKPQTAPNQMAWEYDSPFGGRWNLSFVAKTSDPPDRFRITGTLTPVR
jgi:putative intracellular protease/amidase